MSRINKFVFWFKELFWDDIKDMLFFFSFILVMEELALPNVEPFFRGVLGIIMILVSIAFVLDRFYDSGVLNKPKELNKKIKQKKVIKI